MSDQTGSMGMPAAEFEIDRLRQTPCDVGGDHPDLHEQAADEIKRLQARVEALEGVYLMARRYLFDPNWDTHRQNLVNALKKAATEQEGET